jgi:hypothetical protein
MGGGQGTHRQRGSPLLALEGRQAGQSLLQERQVGGKLLEKLLPQGFKVGFVLRLLGSLALLFQEFDLSVP